MSEVIRAHGIDELARDFRSLEARLEDDLPREGREVTTDIVEDAKGRAGGLGGVAAKSIPAITTSDTDGDFVSAAIVLNGDAYPYAAGAEFGAQQYPQFRPFLGSGSDAGYFLYPAIRHEAASLDDRLYDVVDRALVATDLT